MKARLIKIGNSRGVRLPASVIEACGFDGEIEMQVEGDALVLRKLPDPRAGWEQAFEKALAEEGADSLLLDESPNAADDDEWTW
jgi:antitoxin MazE